MLTESRHSEEAKVNHAQLFRQNRLALPLLSGIRYFAPIDTRQRGIIEDGLFDLGELHRIEGLQPPPELIEQIQSRA